MHKLNKEGSRQGAKSGGEQGRRVERTAFPVFDGDQDNWADFKGIFKGMVKISNLEAVLELAQLRDRIPEAAKKLLVGV